MALINATYAFTPTLTGGNIVVTGETEGEIKTKVLAQLNTRLAAQNATIPPIQNVIDAMSL